MKRLLTKAGTAMLAMCLAVPVVVWAQDDKPREPETRPEPKPEPKGEPKHQDQPEHRDEVNPPKQENRQRPEESRQQEHPEKKAARPTHGKRAHIPDAQFRAHFGRGHTVVIHQPVIVEGQPRFQFGGYWFVISDPWPDGWAYTDECYVDYVDGDYFLFDLLHPGVRLALFVAM